MSSLNLLADQWGGARVIVTGASGFIGLNLVKRLSELNAEVLVIDRIQPGEQFPNVEFEWADLRHLDTTYEADYLIHLAAVTNAGYAERYPIDAYEINVLGTANLLNHVRINKRVFFPSTALVYKASDLPISEDGEADVSSTYAQSKSMGEQIVKFACNRMDVGYTLVRFFNIYGTGQLPMYIAPQILRQIAEEHRVVVRNGSVMRDLLYIDDCIDAVLKLVITPEAQGTVFNIGSGEIVSINDVASSAVEASGQEEVSITDLGENIAYSPTSIRADIRKVQSTIDWHPSTSLIEGLKIMWENYARTG